MTEARFICLSVVACSENVDKILTTKVELLLKEKKEVS